MSLMVTKLEGDSSKSDTNVAHSLQIKFNTFCICKLTFAFLLKIILLL